MFQVLHIDIILKKCDFNYENFSDVLAMHER